MRHGQGAARPPLVVIALALCAFALAAACSGISHRAIRTDHRAFSIPKDAHTDLVVNTFNGNVDVTAIGLGTADVSVTPHGTGFSDADAQSALGTVQVTYDESGTTLTVTASAVGDAPAGTSRGADVDIQVPPDTDVTITTSNGHVEVVNVEGSSTVRTSNGAVTTRAGAGVTIDTSNGPVTLAAPAGIVHVTTSNAGIDILDARDVLAQVQTANGAISFSGALAPGAQSFTTSNASVTLNLAKDEGFTIDAATSNAAASSDFPGVTGGAGTLTGSVGDGSAQITARTLNGPIQVLQSRP